MNNKNAFSENEMRFFICVDVYKSAELFPGKYFVEKLVDFVEYFPENKFLILDIKRSLS